MDEISENWTNQKAGENSHLLLSQTHQFQAQVALQNIKLLGLKPQGGFESRFTAIQSL